MSGGETQQEVLQMEMIEVSGLEIDAMEIDAELEGNEDAVGASEGGEGVEIQTNPLPTHPGEDCGRTFGNAGARAEKNGDWEFESVYGGEENEEAESESREKEVDAIVERILEEHKEEIRIMEERGEFNTSVDLDKILEEHGDGVEKEDDGGGW